MGNGNPLSGIAEHGVYVVVYRHHVSPERLLGVALSLDGAMWVALDSGELELSVETSDGVWEKVPASSKDKRAVDAFRWQDDSKVIWGVSEFKPGHIGSYALEAVFQDECWGIHVHWTGFRAE